MSHGPFGLGGGTLAPACWAIVNVAPISVSASASISTRLVLVFMSILFALPGLFRHLLFLPGGRRPCVWNCSNPVRRRPSLARRLPRHGENDQQPDHTSGKRPPNIPHHVPGCSSSGFRHYRIEPPIREFRVLSGISILSFPAQFSIHSRIPYLGKGAWHFQRTLAH